MLKIFKYEALGNDYIIVDPEYFNMKLNKNIIKLLCERNYGIGSDGILYGPIYKKDNISLKIFNPDGSEAEKSGNGLRIFSKYLFDERIVTNKTFYLTTISGKVKVKVLDDTANLIKIDMGKTSFNSNEIPVIGNEREVINEKLEIDGDVYYINCLTIGNPHCVIIVDKVSKELVSKLGPKIEKNQIFPNRINLQIVEVLDSENIKIEIWERGAGYTLASGSSSCAAATVAYRLGLVKENINVHMPGGIININIEDNVFMTGTVNKVFEGFMSGDFVKTLKKYK